MLKKKLHMQKYGSFSLQKFPDRAVIAGRRLTGSTLAILLARQIRLIK
jgi:hypothetical protein